MELRDPWTPISDVDVGRAFEDELRLELPESHVLAGEQVQAVARREDRDDVLFALPGLRWAIVHLTWRQARESDPRWPAAELFPSADDLAARLEADRREVE